MKYFFIVLFILPYLGLYLLINHFITRYDLLLEETKSVAFNMYYIGCMENSDGEDCKIKATMATKLIFDQMGE